MFTSLFKNFIIFFTSFFLADKIRKSFCPSLFLFIKYAFYSFCLTVIMILAKHCFPYFTYLIPALCFFIFLGLLNRKWSHSVLCIALTSYVINYLIFYTISLLLCVLLYILLGEQPFSDMSALTIIISLLYPGLLILTLKSSKIYKGLSSFVLNGTFNYSTLACLIALITLTFEHTSLSGKDFTRRFRATIVPICLMIILYWLRSQITKTYHEKLRLLELKTLRTAKAENEAYITKLEAENKRLGTIIHKDNRIVNAMADSVCDYLSSSANSSTTDLQTKGQSLSDEINSVKTYRQELLCQGSQSGSSIPQTNQTGVDAIISFMVKEAARYGITMKFHFDGEFFTAKHFTATEMDFVHLLSDLLENAIIATRHANGKAIELSLQILKGTPAISVADSGIPFEIETFMKLGTCEASTHTDEGGTGIGLMDIWTFKKKYHASLVIEELDNSTYSKRLSILFDNRNKYLIISNRFQQIISNQTRSDLLVINSSTNELTELIEE